MKKYLTVFGLLIPFIFCFTITSLPQNRAASNGKAPIQFQNIKKVKSQIPVNFLAPGDTVYGWESFRDSTFVSGSGGFHYLALWIPPNFASCGVRGGNGIYYVMDVGSPASLWTIDPISGVASEVGQIQGLGSGVGINGMAYDPVNSSYYLCGGTNNLYQLDINTLTATLVSSFPNPSGIMIAIAINSSGVGYGYDIVDDNAYSFDPVTGTSTLLGPIGFDANYGQDMDIDQASGTIYLSAFNGTTLTAQLRIMDPNTGATTLLIDYGYNIQISVFDINNYYGPVPGPGQATNPNPANGATGVALNAQLSWTNPAGAASIEVFFGTDPNNLTSIYSGTPVTSVDPGTLSSYTTYYWRVDETDSTGITTGSVWNFTTMQVLPPNVYIDEHFNDLNNWTIVGLGQTNWSIQNSNNAGGTPPEAQFSWSPSFVGESWLMCNNVVTGLAGGADTLIFKQYENWYTDPYTLLVGMTSDGGTTWDTLWIHQSNGGSNGPSTDTLVFTGIDNEQIGFGFSGNSFNINWWYLDDVYLSAYSSTPVEMTSFNANVNQGNVNLNWSTATETNNRGFEIERLNPKFEIRNPKWKNIGFVNGSGTTTQPHTYSYTDSKLTNGVYTYRIKQVDFDGTFKYSNEATANVNVPVTYSLKQNYPNPFNPTTKIDFSLATDSKVTVKVFDILGREVADLLNSNLSAGEHSINFNAENFESGVYFYRLKAGSFVQEKKMVLLK